jgi:hypothetical protein
VYRLWGELYFLLKEAEGWYQIIKKGELVWIISFKRKTRCYWFKILSLHEPQLKISPLLKGFLIAVRWQQSVPWEEELIYFPKPTVTQRREMPFVYKYFLSIRDVIVGGVIKRCF